MILLFTILSLRKPVFRVSDKVKLKPACMSTTSYSHVSLDKETGVRQRNEGMAADVYKTDTGVQAGLCL